VNDSYDRTVVSCWQSYDIDNLENASLNLVVSGLAATIAPWRNMPSVIGGWLFGE